MAPCGPAAPLDCRPARRSIDPPLQLGRAVVALLSEGRGDIAPEKGDIEMFLRDFHRRRALHPFRELAHLQRQMSRLLDASLNPGTGTAGPAVNVWTNATGAQVVAEVPGVDPDQLEISVVGDTLTLTLERPDEVLPEGARTLRRERATGRFVRTVQLPFRLDPDSVEARIANGILTIRLARPESDKPRRIQIQQG